MILNSKRIVIKNFQKKDIDNEYISWLNNKILLKYSRNKKKNTIIKKVYKNLIF